MALPSSLQDFIPHFHLRLRPHGLFCASSCQHSHTESPGKTPTLPSALRLVLPTPKSPLVACSQLRRLLQHPPGKCPSCSPTPAPKPSCLQVLWQLLLLTPSYVLACLYCSNRLSLGHLYQTALSGSEFGKLGSPKELGRCQHLVRDFLLLYHEERPHLAEGGG